MGGAAKREPDDSGLPLGQLLNYGLAKVIPGIVMLLSIPVWISLFGADAYAQYSIVWAGTVLSCSVSLGWLRQALLRGTGMADRSLHDPPRPLIFVLMLAAALPVMLLTWLVQGRGTVDLAIATVAAGLFAFTFAGSLLALTMAQRSERAKAYNAAEVVRSVLGLICSVSLGQTVGVEAGLGVLLVGNLVGNIGGIITANRLTRPGRTHVHPFDTQAAWAYGWPLGIWVTLAALVLYLDRFILKFSITPGEFATYVATADLVVRGMSMLSYPIAMAVYPASMRLQNSGNDLEALRLVRRWTWVLAGLLFAAVAGITLVGPSLLETVIDGSNVEPLIIMALALGAGGWQLALLVHKPLEFARRTQLMLWLLAMAVLSEALTTLVLVGTYGAVGAAIGLAVGSVTYLLSCLYVSRRAVLS